MLLFRPSLSTFLHLPALLLCTLLVGGCGGPDAENDALPAPENADVYEDVRGEFQAPATDGRDVIVHHEAIPDFMDAMLMTLPVDRPGSLDTLDAGTPIMFDLHVGQTAIQVRNIRVLPDTITLNLPEDVEPDEGDNLP
mgnify:CR=1 FL=1